MVLFANECGGWHFVVSIIHLDAWAYNINQAINLGNLGGQMTVAVRPLMMTIISSPSRESVESANEADVFLWFVCRDDLTQEEHKVEFRIDALAHYHRAGDDLIFVATDKGGARYSAVCNPDEDYGTMVRTA